MIGRRSIDESELPLGRWNVETLGFFAGGNNREARTRARPPFAEWTLLERNYGPDKPRELMSLLFIGADGVTLLRKLYVENRATPACVAIIQPSNEMGGSNWTDFTNPTAVLSQTLMQNSAGNPRFLLYGGFGKPEWYQKTCWPAYSRCLAWPLRKTIGALSFWERAA